METTGRTLQPNLGPTPGPSCAKQGFDGFRVYRRVGVFGFWVLGFEDQRHGQKQQSNQEAIWIR